MVQRTPTWYETVVQCLKAKEVKMVAYVPDKVTWRALSILEDDPYFKVVPATREEEAIAIIAGAYAANTRGAVFMQSSGWGNCLNAIGSLCIPFRIPMPIFISMRGDLGEFNIAQVPMGRAIAPIFDVMALPYYTLARSDEVERIVNGAVDLCFANRSPVGLLLSTLLTGGKRGTP